MASQTCTVLSPEAEAIRLPFERPHCPFYPIRMALVGIGVLAIGSIPDLHSFIPGGRGNTFAIGRPCHRQDAVRMACVCVGVAAISGLPDFYCFISGARGDAFAIGGPCHREHLIRMSHVSIGIATIKGIPDLHSLVIGCRGDAFAGGTILPCLRYQNGLCRCRYGYHRLSSRPAQFCPKRQRQYICYQETTPLRVLN